MMRKTVSDVCQKSCMLITARPGIDFAKQGVWRGTRFISLLARTFAISAYLVRYPNVVIPVEPLLVVGWPDEPHVPADLIRHIHAIRQAFEIHMASYCRFLADPPL